MNNLQLVTHVQQALTEKWGYVYGTYGKVLTQNILDEKIMMYPKNINSYLPFIKANWLGKRTVDCVGLIKSALWWLNDDPIYHSTNDKSADGMFKVASKSGTIDTIPEIPGILVWKRGHIGVYIGKGQVIESHGTTSGVIKTPLSGNGATPWTNWCQCLYIDYISAPVVFDWERVLTSASLNPDVWKRAIRMAELGTAKTTDLTIIKYLPQLIENICKIYKGG